MTPIQLDKIKQINIYKQKEDGAQIKTVSWTGPNKQLKVNRNDLKKALCNSAITKYVLAAMDPGHGGEKIELIGWISKENFKKKFHTEEKWGEDLLLIDENQLDFLYMLHAGIRCGSDGMSKALFK